MRVLEADGTVRESVPRSHGKGILALKDQAPGTNAAEAVAATPFLDSGLVDRVVAYLPHGEAPSNPSGVAWPVMTRANTKISFPAASAFRTRVPDHVFQAPGIGEIAEEHNLALPDPEDLD